MLRNDMIEEFKFKGKSITLIYGDITNVNADVIVSSDDNHISMGGGVSMAIHEAGGDVLWEESRKYIPAQLGTVVVTSAGKLHAKYIFHAIVIDFEQMKWPDIEILKIAATSCLQEANKLLCHTIALPAFGTGAGGLSSESAAIAVINVIFENLEKYNELNEVYLVLNRKDTLFDFVKKAIEARVRSEYEPKLEILKAEKEKLVAELQEKSPYRKLPYPIAVARHLIDSHGNYHSKFTSTIECGESIIKYCASVVLAEYLQQNSSSKQELQGFFKQPVSLGSWLSQLDKTLSFLKGRPCFSVISQIHDAYLSKNKGYFSDFVKVRNENYGHGATLADESYKPMYESLSRKLESVLKDFNFLNDYPLIVVDQTDITEAGFDYEIIKVMGDNIIFTREKMSVKDLRLSRHALYIIDEPNGRALCLNPFMIFETCPFCQVQETFFLEKNSEKDGIYHTYRANHRITTEKYKSFFQNTK